MLHNVFLHPPFGYQAFINHRGYTAKLPATQTPLFVAEGTVLAFNYVECNRSQPDLVVPDTFIKHLQARETIRHFVADPRIASFGGCERGNRPGTRSRTCPAAPVSLWEQCVVLATLLRGYTLHPEGRISEVVDETRFPLHERVRDGMVTLKKRAL